MNLLFESNYPHTSRGTVIQPLLSPKTTSLQTKDQLTTILCSHWPLQDLNFHIRLDQALAQWQLLFFEEMEQIQKQTDKHNEELDYSKLNDLLEIWLKVVKKMEFYRVESDFKKLTFHRYGLYRLYDLGDLKSIYLLSEIEKYKASE